METHLSPSHPDHILIVDDDSTTRMLLRESLVASGFQVTEACDGEEALRIFGDVEPDLVLLDVVMPNLDGYDVCRQLRAHPNGDEVPILMATSLEDVDSINRAYTVGASDFITKPINWALIGHRVRYMVRGGHIQQRLRQSETRFRSLIENTADLISLLDPDGELTYTSPSVERALRHPPEELIGCRLERFVHDEDVPLYRNCLALARGSKEAHSAVLRLATAEGVWLEMESIFMAMTNPDGTLAIVVNSRDVTDRLIAEAALRESEEQLQQSQKMEAIGRLAGGVAHDFNNLLTAILGYSQILDERLQAEGNPSEEIREVRKAGQRAGSLTRQLLTFSRKQILQPRVIDLNATTLDMEKMLRRLMGEDVELVTRLAPELSPVTADPGQIEQVVMNLAVNARDAMPTGGTLVIETANVFVDEAFSRLEREVIPGEYVMIAVSDNGSGMDSVTLEKIYEPFFTTKEEGKGTGLGLSTVYGIVKQSQGYIWTYSEPGQGTTFKVYLPATAEPAVGIGNTPASDEELVGTETVLLAEDEAWVRKLVTQCLEQRGYMVLGAEDAEQAIQIHERYMGSIDLLLTDVVMPRMNGVDLAERISADRPKCRTLFMSGYTDHAILQHGHLPPDRAFLQKPFTIRDLASQIREVLDRSEALSPA